jgi:hypothetical protein
MEIYGYSADSLARNHIRELVADADASRRAKLARRARSVRGKAKNARG